MTQDANWSRWFGRAVEITRSALFIGLCSWPISLYAYAVRARVNLGYWPSYGRPDPKHMGWVNHRYGVYLALEAFIISVVVLPIVLVILRYWLRRKIRWSSVLAYFGLAAFGLAVLFA